MNKALVYLGLSFVLVGCTTVQPAISKSGYVSPVRLTQPLPEFPRELRVPGTTVHIEVNFLIARSGRVVKAFPVSPPNPAIDRLVLESVAKWTYRPGTVDGRAVNVDMQLPIDFSIDEGRHVTAAIGSYPGDPSPEAMVPDVQPKVVSTPTPAPPARAPVRRGTVVVDFLVTSYGDVREAFVLKSASAELDAAALGAVKQWKFEPALKNGRPILCHMQVPVVF